MRRTDGPYDRRLIDVPEGERGVPPLRPARARAARPAALARDRGSRADDARGAPLVGRAQDGADARRAERARRGRGRRPARQAARLGPGRALVPGDARRDAGREASAVVEENGSARSACGSRRAPGRASRRRGRPGADARITFLSPFDRLVHDRDRARQALGLLLPARDVRPEGEARVRLLRPADPAGDRLVGRIEPVHDRKTGMLEAHGTWWEGKPVAARPAAAQPRALAGRESLPSPHGLRDPRDPRRPGARPGDRRDHHADLPDLDVRAGGGRRAQGLRLRARRRTRRGTALQVASPASRTRSTGSRSAPGSARRRRSCTSSTRASASSDRRRLRRRLPDVVAGLRAEGLPVHLRAGERVRRQPRRRTSTSDVRLVWVETPSNPLLNIVDIRRPPTPRTRSARCSSSTTRSRRRTCSSRSSSAPTSSSTRRRSTSAATATSIGGFVATNDDALAERLLLPAEVARRRARPVRLLARPARAEDARRAHARSTARTHGASPSSSTATRASSACSIRARSPIPATRSRARQMRDFGGMVSFLVETRGGGRRARRADEDLPARGVARRRREPDRASGADDPCVDRGRAVRAAGEPRPPVGRDRIGRRPDRRSRSGAGQGSAGCRSSIGRDGRSERRREPSIAGIDSRHAASASSGRAAQRHAADPLP